MLLSPLRPKGCSQSGAGTPTSTSPGQGKGGSGQGTLTAPCQAAPCRLGMEERDFKEFCSDVFQQQIKIAATVLIRGSGSSGTRGTGSISRGGDSPRSLCLERCQRGAGHQRPGDAWPQAECPNGSQVGSGGINSGCPGFSFSYSEVL